MIERVKSHPYVTIAILISVANVILVWTYRFLPLYDYPVWLYEVHIMRNLLNPLFDHAYQIIRLPIPNLGFVVPVWLLSFLFPIETAGKIFLSVCIVAFPWSIWFCIRRLAGNPNTSLAFVGFPFAFNSYFFAGNAFLLGLIFLMVMIGLFFSRLGSFTTRNWIVLSGLFLLGYFIHLLTFILLTVVFTGAVLFTKERKKQLPLLLVALLPSFICFSLYATSAPPEGPTHGMWSVWGLAQNILKPVFLFVKSYAISNPLPLTFMNLFWAGIVAVLAGSLLLSYKKEKQLDVRFILPVAATFILALGLPEWLSGVKEPGTRFGLPFVLFVVMMFSRQNVSEYWKSIFLTVSLLVLGYYTFHFHRTADQMQQLYADVTTHVDMKGKSFRTFRFDYPPPRNMWDVAAASIDPLFGVSSYAAMEAGGGPTWIFGTSLLTYKPGNKHLHPLFRDATTDELANDMFKKSYYSLTYDVAILVGTNHIVNERMGEYEANKFHGRDWWILEPNQRSVQQQKKENAL